MEEPGMHPATWTTGAYAGNPKQTFVLLKDFCTLPLDLRPVVLSIS